MHRARGFFFICAGLLMLSVAYNLGASSAVAQSTPTVFGIDMGGNSGMAVMGRTIYWLSESGTSSALPSVPGSSPIAAIGAQGLGSSGGAVAVLQNADVYRFDTVSSSWQRTGNILSSGPIPTTKSSWGEVKARFR